MKLPLRTKIVNQTIELIHKVVLPHRLWASMWENGASEFEQFWMGNDRSKLRNFWMGLPPDHRPAREHLDTTIPVKFFGDGVAVLGISKTWGKTAHAFLVTPMVTAAMGRSSQVLLSILWKNKLAPGAYRKFMQCLSWSFQHSQLDNGLAGTCLIENLMQNRWRARMLASH